MCQTRSQVIARAVEENLRFVLEPAKRARMNNAGPVPLKLSAISVARLGKRPSSRIAGFLRERGEHTTLVGLHFFPRFRFAARNLCPARIFGHGKEYASRGGRASLELTARKTRLHGYTFSMRQRSKNQIARKKAAAIEPVASRNRWPLLGVCVFLLAITWIVFGQTLHFEFINFDDGGYVYEN